MSRRSALIAAFLAISVYSSPAGALTLTAIVLAPIAIAQAARAYTREPADA